MHSRRNDELSTERRRTYRTMTVCFKDMFDTRQISEKIKSHAYRIAGRLLTIIYPLPDRLSMDFLLMLSISRIYYKSDELPIGTSCGSNYSGCPCAGPALPKSENQAPKGPH